MEGGKERPILFPDRKGGLKNPFVCVGLFHPTQVGVERRDGD